MTGVKMLARKTIRVNSPELFCFLKRVGKIINRQYKLAESQAPIWDARGLFTLYSVSAVNQADSTPPTLNAAKSLVPVGRVRRRGRGLHPAQGRRKNVPPRMVVPCAGMEQFRPLRFPYLQKPSSLSFRQLLIPKSEVFYKPCHPAFSGARPLHLRPSFLPQGLLPCSSAKLRCSFTPHLPAIEFA